MSQVPTLEELTAQLDAQNAELAETARLAETIAAGSTIDKSALAAFDDCVEPRVTAGNTPLCHGIRA
jgi:hypothetical protein